MVAGVLLLFAGIVFSLQGADIITGSSVMSGNSNYIYVGAVVAIIGVALLTTSSRAGRKPESPIAPGPPQTQ